MELESRHGQYVITHLEKKCCILYGGMVKWLGIRSCAPNFSKNILYLFIYFLQGGSGYARNISFEKITLIGAKNPIIIDQNYCNGKRHCGDSVSFYVHVVI